MEKFIYVSNSIQKVHQYITACCWCDTSSTLSSSLFWEQLTLTFSFGLFHGWNQCLARLKPSCSLWYVIQPVHFRDLPARVIRNFSLCFLLTAAWTQIFATSCNSLCKYLTSLVKPDCCPPRTMGPPLVQMSCKASNQMLPPIKPTAQQIRKKYVHVLKHYLLLKSEYTFSLNRLKWKSGESQDI